MSISTNTARRAGHFCPRPSPQRRAAITPLEPALCCSWAGQYQQISLATGMGEGCHGNTPTTRLSVIRHMQTAQINRRNKWERQAETKRQDIETEIDSRRKTRAVYDRFGGELSLCLSIPSEILLPLFLFPCLSFSSQCLKALFSANRVSTRLFWFAHAESLYNTIPVSLLATDT